MDTYGVMNLFIISHTMAYKKTAFLFIILGLCVDQCCCIGIVSVESQLYMDLFSNYSRDVRPVEGDFRKQIVVQVVIGLAQIESLNEREENLISHGFIRFSWTDELLQWNPSAYGNITMLIVPSEKVWLPEISPLNSVADSNELAYAESESRVRILPTGRVTWVPLMQWSTSCAINITDFPYDQQECRVEFASWMYPCELVNFTVAPEVVKTLFTNNSAWDLVETTASFFEMREDPFGIPFITLKLKLKRIPTFFEMNVAMPATLLSVLLIPLFMLPVESGEKVSLGITLMLSYSIFMLVLTEYTPVSGSLPIMSLAILICMIFAGMGLFCNVAIINLHHHSPYKGVPNWMKRILLRKVGYGLCCMKDHEKLSWNTKVEPFIVEEKDGHDEKAIPIKQNPIETYQLVEYMEFFKAKQLHNEDIEQNRQDWHRVARVLDRIFLILYTVYFLAFFFAVLISKYSAS